MNPARLNPARLARPVSPTYPACVSLEELSPEQRRRYYQYLASLTPEQRLVMALDAIDTARALMEAGIRHRHPDASEREVQAHIAARLCGAALARRLYHVDVELP